MKISKLTLAVILSSVLLALMLLPQTARADKYKFFYVTGAPTLYSVNNTTVTSSGSTSIVLPCPPRDVQVEASFSSTNLTGTSNVIWGFNTSGASISGATPPAGVTPTNSFTSTTWLTGTNKCAANTTVVDRFIIPATNLVGISALRWDSTSSTQPGNVTVNWLRVSYVVSDTQ